MINGQLGVLMLLWFMAREDARAGNQDAAAAQVAVGEMMLHLGRRE